MKKMFIIAKKEFVDLLNNRIILLSIVTFIVILLIIIYDTVNIVSGSVPDTKIMYQENPSMMVISRIFLEMLLYGSLLGVIIGSCSLSVEKASSALNILVAKPVHRNTIINGKILGTLAFLSLMMMIIMASYTLFMLQFYGAEIMHNFADYCSRSALALFVLLVYVTIFIAVSMLLSTVTRKQSNAIIISILLIYLMEIIPGMSGNLSIALAGLYEDAYGLGGTLAGITPKGLAITLQNSLFNGSISTGQAIEAIASNVLGLAIYASVAIVLTYVVFTRRDIS